MLYRLSPFGLAALLLPAVCGAPASAQGSPDLALRWSGGVLGWSWTLELQGAPGASYVLAPSLGSGPTPLALVDPRDPRALDVGTDLLSFWRFGQLGPAGLGSQTYLLPPNAALVGQDVRAQAVEVPGATGLFGDLSDAVEVRLSLLGSAVLPQGQPVATRRDHAQIGLADGRVLLAGGQPIPGAALDLELFDPQTQRFEKSNGALPVPLWHQEATLLADGRVLLTGGVESGRGVSDRAFLFDPLADKLTALPPMNAARVFHTATLLDNGRVLIAGGASKFAAAHPIGFPDSAQSPQASCELFDPATGKWLPSLPLPTALVGHAATRTPSGTVLISGGVRPTSGANATSSTLWQRQDPGHWTAAGQLLEPRAFHTQQLSASGDAVLIASGADVDEATGSVQGTPTSETWSTTSGQSAQGPPSPAIVINGVEVCIPLPRLPKFPTGQLEYISEFEEDPTLGPPIVYWMGGGYNGLTFGGGASQPNAQDLTTLYFSEDWELVGPRLSDGPGQRVTSIDEGLRRLSVGPNGATLVTAE